MTAKAKHDPPLKIPMEFDEAMKRAIQVRPPEGGWKKYEKKLKRARKRRRSKKAA
jgi:hypothetical protein